MHFKSSVLLLAAAGLAAQVSGASIGARSGVDLDAISYRNLRLTRRQNRNGGGGNNNNGGGGGASETCLAANAIQTGSAETGQNGAITPGQVESKTDAANFINFCEGQTLTNGLQTVGGSCNGVVMGKIPAKINMVSSIILSPSPGQVITAGETFDIEVQTRGLAAGAFTNAASTYYSAPQDLDNGGSIVGHCHVTVQDLGGSFTPNQALDPEKFAFFKGINDEGNGQGLLKATVTDGLQPGFYRVCTMNSAANHQPVLMPIAQRGAQDDCQKFEVRAGNGGGGGGNNEDNPDNDENTDANPDNDNNGGGTVGGGGGGGQNNGGTENDVDNNNPTGGAGDGNGNASSTSSAAASETSAANGGGNNNNNGGSQNGGDNDNNDNNDNNDDTASTTSAIDPSQTSDSPDTPDSGGNNGGNNGGEVSTTEAPAASETASRTRGGGRGGRGGRTRTRNRGGDAGVTAAPDTNENIVVSSAAPEATATAVPAVDEDADLGTIGGGGGRDLEVSQTDTPTPTTSAANEAATTVPTTGPAAPSVTAIPVNSGDLGGTAPPVLESGKKGRPFCVGKNTFTNAAAAVQRACDVQFNRCADAANADDLDGKTVADCEAQKATCGR